MGMISTPWIEEAMEEKGIKTQKELAEKAGVAIATVGRAIKKGELRSDTAEKVQSVFGKDILIGPAVMGGDSLGIRKAFIEAEKQGNHYEVHQSECIAQVRIYHNEKERYLIYSTFSFSQEGWQKEAVRLAEELNAKGVRDV